MANDAHKIVFFNGPRKSGKDTAAGFLFTNFSARVYKMARPMDKALQAFFDIPDHIWKRVREDYKLEPNGHMLDDVPVQALISLSEEWAKVRYGQDVFGRLALRHLREATATDFTAISDSGFRYEAEPIVKHFGADNCLLIRLRRDGCTFDGDSRGYIELADLGVTEIDLYNHMEKDFFQRQVCRAVSKWSGIGCSLLDNN